MAWVARNLSPNSATTSTLATSYAWNIKSDGDCSIVWTASCWRSGMVESVRDQRYFLVTSARRVCPGWQALLPGLLTLRALRAATVARLRLDGRGATRPVYHPIWRWATRWLTFGSPASPFLDGAGRNLGRKMLGRGRGAVTKLDADESASLGLHRRRGNLPRSMARTLPSGLGARLGERCHHVPGAGAIEVITVLGEPATAGRTIALRRPVRRAGSRLDATPSWWRRKSVATSTTCGARRRHGRRIPASW